MTQYKTAIISILFLLSINAASQTQADSIYATLTLHEKLQYLFADTLCFNTSVPAIKTNISERTVVPACLINLSEMKNRNPSAPQPKVFQNITDLKFIAAHHLHLIQNYSGLNVSGIYTNEDGIPKAQFIKPVQPDSLIDYLMVSFPQEAISYLPTTPLRSSDQLLMLNRGRQNRPFSIEEHLKERHLFYGNNKQNDIAQLEQIFSHRIIDESLLEERVKELIQLRSIKTPAIPIKMHTDNYWNFEVYKRNIKCYASDFEFITDFSNVEIALYDNETAQSQNLLQYIKRYTDNSFLAHPSVLSNAANLKYFVVAARSAHEINEAAEAIMEVERQFNNHPVLFIVGKINPRELTDQSLSVFHAIFTGFGPASLVADLQTQALFGGIALDKMKKTPVWMDGQHFRPTNNKKNRLGYSPAENASLSQLTLNKIDETAEEMIRLKAAPGAQVLVARNGQVVFQKSYGREMYAKGMSVNNQSIYDLASVTKVMGSTPLMMMLYDQKKIDNTTTLGQILPAARYTNKDDITMVDLLIHQAGLPAFIPYYLQTIDSVQINRPIYSNRYSKEYSIQVDKRLYMMTEVPYKNTIFSHHNSGTFNIRVSDKLFMNQEFKQRMIAQIYTDRLRKKEYRYSDLTFYLAQQIIEQEMNLPENEAFDKYFASPLGANRLTFLPLEKFKASEIMPTEDDRSFRRELLRGYVHDPGAAMMGGVAGHAGLFSNSNDLAKMAQMLLNRGEYGGRRYITSSTIDLFTKKQKAGNRRGLGFDKPDSEAKPSDKNSLTLPESSYGHSGFTGTYIWIDPDNSLIYIFLSNRVYPQSFNNKLSEMSIRSKIHHIIYQSIMEK